MNKKYTIKNRRNFLKNSSAIAIGGSLGLHFTFPEEKNYLNTDTLKIGLVGCGGRGTGAAVQALRADSNVILTAMGDVFKDRLDSSFDAITQEEPSKMKVDEGHRFIGFDAYKKVIESDVDLVLLTTPPAFRPTHLMAAIKAGKHVFCEKPVAVDPAGVRKVIEAAKLAKSKNLGILSGFCFRWDNPKKELFERVTDGAVGDITAVSATRNGGSVWYKPRQDSWTNMEYQLRNWYYRDWLSGDFLVEMTVHSADMMAWALNDEMPVRATATGGQQTRLGKKYGNIYDHFAVEYEYSNGRKGFLHTRQQQGCSGKNVVDVFGTKGIASVKVGGTHKISGKKVWKYNGEKNNMFQTEHDVFFNSIRNGDPMNDGVWMAESTMMAILGRMAAYSGQTISWDDALASDFKSGPDFEKYSWDLDWPDVEPAIPGISKVL